MSVLAWWQDSWLFWYYCVMAVTVASARSAGDLLGLIRGGRQPGYLMFWGHRPPDDDDGAGRSCLSQWWPVTFAVDGLTYRSAEHFMMAAKALLFGDNATAEQIQQAPDPAAAKAPGRQVPGFSEERWAAHRFDVVVAGNIAKFGQHPGLRQFLLGTGDRVLAEASARDPIWGIGLPAEDSRAAHPEHWPGLNLLGFALMEVRQRLEAEHGGQVSGRPFASASSGIKSGTRPADTCAIWRAFCNRVRTMSITEDNNASRTLTNHVGR
ncbi:MAG TPA: NADAR family protein [Streptosporangiaceae bacterium]|nr:NADAR family protein [Streptosporangiaceae bacterium]